jgi:hypothetical protein
LSLTWQTTGPTPAVRPSKSPCTTVFFSAQRDRRQAAGEHEGEQVLIDHAVDGVSLGGVLFMRLCGRGVLGWSGFRSRQETIQA